MPPRFSYWTIILDGQPTAFRAADPQELQPTLNQLRKKNPNAEMKWFARGKVWESPEESKRARTDSDNAAKDAALAKERGRSWRPGGEHKDPREKFKKETFQAHKRREKKAANLAREAAIERRDAPPSDEARGAGVSAFAGAPADRPPADEARGAGVSAFAEASADKPPAEEARGAESGAHQDASPERKAPDDRGDRRPFKPAGPPSPRATAGSVRLGPGATAGQAGRADRGSRRAPAVAARGSRRDRRSRAVEAEGDRGPAVRLRRSRRLTAGRATGRAGRGSRRDPAIVGRGSRGRIVGPVDSDPREATGRRARAGRLRPEATAGQATGRAGRGSRRGPAIEARGSRRDLAIVGRGSRGRIVGPVDSDPREATGRRARAGRLRPEATAGQATVPRGPWKPKGPGDRGPWKPKGPGDRGPWKPREDRGPGGFGPPRGDRPQGQGGPPSPRGYGGSG